jgi:hypothetical protein
MPYDGRSARVRRLLDPAHDVLSVAKRYPADLLRDHGRCTAPYGWAMSNQPGVDRRPLEVVNEFLALMNDVAGAHALSLVGLIQLRSVVLDVEPENRTVESTMFIGHGDPNSPEGFAYQRWRLDELPNQLHADGPIVRALGQQWVVMVASQWNDHYRQRLADAKGIAKNDVADPYLADVNRMRNDVVHHRGIATKRNTGRCEQLRWFDVGEPIHVMPAHIAEFMAYLGLVEPSAPIDGGTWEPKLSA